MTSPKSNNDLQTNDDGVAGFDQDIARHTEYFRYTDISVRSKCFKVTWSSHA